MSVFLAPCDICLAGAAVARRNVGKDIIAQSAGLGRTSLWSDDEKAPVFLQCEMTRMAQSRHPDRVGECLLSGVKRTSKFKRAFLRRRSFRAF
jgi:hypothetical protein